MTSTSHAALASLPSDLKLPSVVQSSTQRVDSGGMSNLIVCQLAANHIRQTGMEAAKIHSDDGQVDYWAYYADCDRWSVELTLPIHAIGQEEKWDAEADCAADRQQQTIPSNVVQHNSSEHHKPEVVENADSESIQDVSNLHIALLLAKQWSARHLPVRHWRQVQASIESCLQRLEFVAIETQNISHWY